MSRFLKLVMFAGIGTLVGGLLGYLGQCSGAT